MNDPRIIRFVNEYLRPMAETIRATAVNAKALLQRWDVDIAPLVVNDSKDVLDDGRLSEGVSQLSGAEIYELVALVTKFSDPATGIADQPVIAKACVRTILV